jgi:hypothetical protein
MEQLFEKLWQQYVEITPSAQKIKLLFTKKAIQFIMIMWRLEPLMM